MNELLHQIASDLSIYKFDYESYTDFGDRILYSALATWGKVQVLGTSYANLTDIDKEYPYTSKRYITEKLKTISEGLIYSIPHNNEWIYSNDNSSIGYDISKFIIEKLLFCYQLSKMNNNKWITATPEKIVYFKNNQLILGGTDWNCNEIAANSVGLGSWQIKDEKCSENYKDIFNIPHCSLKDYYNSIKRNALWQPTDINEEEYEYFSSGTGLWHSKAWKVFNKKYIPEGISVIRNVNQKYNYNLLLNEEGRILTAKLDKWYTSENEIRRIMYALECYRGKPAEFKAKNKGQVIELHCHSPLPDAENRILLMASWPKRNYRDIYVREIPEFLWGDIKYILSNLGIKIIFE